ncbi:nucleoside diphosphate kinase homolog 5-like [Paramacrobiotus metropolitanus]|uniref:nucleoside diphosphate kinase homolog 5-like n=1 Tax=Paramacrobiotus metropolitanus TaxID=2943436 RepID=UPI0024462FEB|nr:nucleoside diphosphate kinase homolog 5-like [Paramacrobiotus metropolitanus]
MAPAVQYLVMIIKPHAVHKKLKIIQTLEQHGFRINGERCIDISFDEAWYICKDERGKMATDSASVENKMQSLMGTAIVLLVSHLGSAFEAVAHALGPEDPAEAVKVNPQSVCARFGETGPFNAVIASVNASAATREIQHFFPRFSDIFHGPISNIAEERIAIDAYFREKMLPTLLDGFYDLCVRKPAQPVPHLSAYLLNNNPNHPKIFKPGEYVFGMSSPSGLTREVEQETQNYAFCSQNRR